MSAPESKLGCAGLILAFAIVGVFFSAITLLLFTAGQDIATGAFTAWTAMKLAGVIVLYSIFAGSIRR